MKIYLTLILLVLLKPAFSQQDPQYSQYMFNTLVINPAYSGYRETLNVSMLHRDQWTGFNGAPKTQSMILDGTIGPEKKVGLGFSIVNDREGLLKQTSAHANYAYRLPVGDESRLAFGISLGIGQYTLNSSDAQLVDITDETFAKQTYFVPDARFGIHYSTPKLYAGVSATNMLANAIDYQQVGKNTIARRGRHYFITAGYLIDLNESFKLKPSVLLKEDTKGPTSLDLNTLVLIKDAIWIGASYRTGVNLWKKTGLNNGAINQNSVVGIVETFFLRNLRAGYSYDHSISSSNSVNGTHEISLGLVLNGGGKKSAALLTPRYF